MTKNQLLALAAFITTLANESGEACEVTSTTTGATAEPAKPKRGRPPTTTTPPAEQPKEPEKPAGKTYEELQEVIRPFVTAGRGAEVKAIIGKYSSENPTLKGLMEFPQHHAAFAADIEQMNY